MKGAKGKSRNYRNVDRRQFLAASGGIAAAGLLGLPNAARAQSTYAGKKVVFASWGGVYQDSQKQGFCDPFAQKTGATVIQDGPVDYGKLALAPGASPLKLDERVMLVPGHCDPTVDRYDWYVGVRDGRVECLWPVSARGAMS